MDDGYKNHEGYPDPTAHRAIRNADSRYRPVVYVCSPYRGDTEKNAANARRFSRFALEAGYIPICPHIYLPQFVSEETERELALFIGIVLLTKCEQIWVFGTRRTEGMKAEIEKARSRGMKERYFTEECREET